MLLHVLTKVGGAEIIGSNTYLTNGFSHHYHLGDSIFIFKGVRSDFCFQLFDENSLSQQNSPRWDATFCGVWGCLPMSHKRGDRLK